jgi:hypothetical protein
MKSNKKKEIIKHIPTVYEQIPEDVEECHLLFSKYDGHEWHYDGWFETEKEAVSAATEEMSEPDSVADKILVHVTEFITVENGNEQYRIPLNIECRDLSSEQTVVVRYS